jgi:hypothetical protein
MDTPEVGARAVCRSCGEAIVWKGEHWDHEGETRPRHIAQPAHEVAMATPAPLQPAWTKELDAREWSQVLHAQSYARDHSGAGAPGHGQFLLIAKLAAMLDAREPHENG